MDASPWFATLDTETTGLTDQADARVIEIAVAVFDSNGALLRTYDRIVNPCHLTEEGLAIAKRVSGITEDQIRSAPGTATVQLEVESALTGPHGKIPVYGWNVGFDRAMWRRTFFRGDIDRKRAEQLDPIRWDGDVMLKFARTFRDVVGTSRDGSPRWVKLTAAAEMAGIRWEGNPHRALADALMTGRLMAGLSLGDIHPPCLEG